MRANVNAPEAKEFLKRVKNYFPGTWNFRQTLPVDEFGKHCIRRGKKGGWTHRL